MTHHASVSAAGRHASARAPTRARSLRALVAQTARNLAARRTVARLEELDDHLLKDIGLTRSDVLWARSLPVWRDPVAELAKRADANRDFKRQHLRCVSEGRVPQDGVRDLAPALSAL